MNRPRTSIIASLLAVACIGAGGGAAVYAVATSGNTKTVVHEVTVNGSEPAASTSPLSINSIYRRSYRGVVDITVQTTRQGQFGDSQQATAEGSGFVLDTDGHIVTNEHVVSGESKITVKFWNGKTYSASLVGADGSTDLAVIKVDAPQSVLFPLQIGDSSKLQVGDSVVAIGSPFGLEETVTSGIVSALHRQMESPSNYTIDDSIQTDAAINHGNSGGPLINSSGQVIGVNSQIQSDSGGSDGVGFAIPSNTVRSIADQLISNGKAVHAYLGVQFQEAANGGAEVAQVVSGAPAAKAGLKQGDVIVQVGDAKIDQVDALAGVVDGHKPGDTVTVTYLRNGDRHSVEVTLGTRPTTSQP
jgi:putative serine protease PepD